MNNSLFFYIEDNKLHVVLFDNCFKCYGFLFLACLAIFLFSISFDFTPGVVVFFLFFLFFDMPGFHFLDIPLNKIKHISFYSFGGFKMMRYKHRCFFEFENFDQIKFKINLINTR